MEIYPSAIISIFLIYFLCPSRFMSQGGPVNQNVSSALWQRPKQWEAVERFANMMFCYLFLLLQGHHKDKNNPPWQICFQKVSFSFSIISEKYCPIVLTPIERFDRGLMYHPVFPVIPKPPLVVLGRNASVWNAPLGTLLNSVFIPDTRWGMLNFENDENLCTNTCR